MLRAVFAFLLLLVAAPQAFAQQISAAEFASPASMRMASISPDGNYVAAIQSVDGGEALVVVDWRTRQARAIQVARYDRSLFLEGVAWKDGNRLLFWVRQRITQVTEGTGSRQRSDAGEVDVVRIYGINRDGTGLTQLFENNRLADQALSVRLIDTLDSDPDHVLMGTWGSAGFTLYRVDVNNGRTAAVEDAAWETFDMIVNREGRAIMRVDALPYHSGYRYFRRPASGGRWTEAHVVRRGQRSQNRDFNPIAAGPGPSQVYVAARAEGQEYQAIYLYDTSTGELGQPIFSYPGADAEYVSLNRRDGSVLVACAETQRWQCRATDHGMQRHFDGLTAYFENRADFHLVNSSEDGQRWLVSAWGPTIPTTFYVYDVTSAQVSVVGSTHPRLPRTRLADARVVNYTARDGQALWGYLTTPSGAGPYPTVVMPHGGPQSRDSYEFDFVVQFLVSRGYAVFQPNFRGSEGSGRSFARAGYGQWGGTMQNDVTDGVQSLITSGVANPARICIAGISYGGYAALAGAALTPDLYKCAISIAGLSDLPEFLDSERADSGRRSDLYAYWREAIGDPSANRDQLNAVSPRRQIDQIHIPILLIHGEKDEVTLASQSERMRDALQRAGKSVRYVEIEGNVYHPWDGWTNRDAERLLTEMETFLNANIGTGAQ
ncbi:MAG: alpha/beta fold hydrolase [Alphaproteobacteria bacterium]|nr:alpha/beta fold hydrolase [Alphaproteobacteria bacterium]